MPGAFLPGQPPERDGASGGRRCVSGCVCGGAGCSKLTTWVNLGLIWRPGSCRSYEWCSRFPRVKSRGRREAAWGSPPERAASAPGQTRGRCLWPPPGDFERTPRSGTEGAGWERTRGGQSPGPTANSCSPSFPLLFILASFLPSFQSVELLSRQVRSRSRSRGWLRKTSISLKGVLLAVMLAEGRSLRISARRGWVGLRAWD